LSDFQTYLQQEKKVAKTIRMYLQEVEAFFTFLSSHGHQLTDIDEEKVIHYRYHLLRKGKKVSTINKSISTLSSFFKWACQEGYFQKNYAEKIRMYQFTNIHRPRLKNDEVILLKKEISKENNPLKKIRNHALIMVLLQAGLRIQEVASLKIDDVFYKEGCIKIQDSEYSRSICLPEGDMYLLIKWLLLRKKLYKKIYIDSPYLFVTERSGQMQPRAIQYLLKKYSDKLGFSVTAQILRNTFCFQQVEKGLDPKQLMEVAGHRSIQTSYQFFQDI